MPPSSPLTLCLLLLGRTAGYTRIALLPGSFKSRYISNLGSIGSACGISYGKVRAPALVITLRFPSA